MADRDAILAALPPSGSAARPEPLVRRLVEADSEGLWTRFEAAFDALGGTVRRMEWLAELAGKSVWADEDALEYLPQGAQKAEGVWEAEFGVTCAQVAVAESGSLLMAAGPGRARLSSLAPPHHVAFVRRDAIIGTLEEAFDRIESRTSVFATGPSRTADIEGVLVRGIHGPSQVTVIVLD